jgi:pilus assembly protein CpaC
LAVRNRDAQFNLAAIDQLYQRGLVPFEPIAQLQPGVPGNPFFDDPDEPDPHAPTPFEILGPSGEMNVTVRRNKILRCKDNLTRVAVVDSGICEFVQFSPREISIIGREVGATHVTFWFANETQRPITYLVRVTPDPELQNETEHEYQILEEVLAELFPDSKVYLIPVADKLIVRGQAKDAEEASQILGILRGEEQEFGSGRRGRLVGGNAAAPIPGGRARTVRSVVNMLQIPGVHQIALKVKIAELNRSAARNSGLNLDANIRFNGGRDGQLLLNTLLNSSTTASIFGAFNDFDIDLGLNYLKTQGVIRVLSEPTLVTMNGKPANFHAGGQFAVPTAVGVGGIGAIATEFKLFGVSVNFLPTILDKDRIRLNISPSFSQVASGLSVGGTPGITDRSVTTTVEMREGQTLAIAGLLEDTMKSATGYDLPFLPRIFGKRDVSREETELIILVTPELVHPMEPEAVPPLPGFDVTEPTDHQFYLGGRIEGLPTHEHRSTVWPRLKHRYQRGGSEMISGPFGHGQ